MTHMRALIFAAAVTLAPAAHAEELADLAWLTGCWRTQGDGPVITEVWTRPPIPAFLGYAYTIGEGETQGWEQTRIDMVEGWPHFVAMPNGGPPVRFRLVEDDTPNIAVFENSTHDFPTHVAYRREGDTLHARVSKGDQGFDIVYQRIACEAALLP